MYSSNEYSYFNYQGGENQKDVKIQNEVKVEEIKPSIYNSERNFMTEAAVNNY